MFHILDDWYVVCRSKDLAGQPRAVTLFGIPLVIFRAKGGAVGALLDRCPHRNAPLSIGSIKDSVLQCAYHGWRFDIAGICRHAAGIREDRITKACHATAYAVREQQGFIWVYGTPGVEPEREPFPFPFIGDSDYTTSYTELTAEASIHAVAENALDVPHTAYLHGGLFRSAGRAATEIEVIVSRFADRVETQYLGEERPSGLAGMLLAPKGGEVLHIDRFFLPSITQVEYKLGAKTHFCVTVALTPVHDFFTRLFAVVSIRLPVPGWIAVPVLRPLFLRIFQQDATILKSQTANINRFGGEQFVSTEADTLGPHIHRLLKMAEAGQRDPGDKEPEVFRTRLMI